MFNYFRTLPDQALPARRRFVVVATAFSFALIVLVWIGVLVIGRRSEPAPSPSPAVTGELPEAPLLASPSPGGSPEPPAAAPGSSPLDVGQISTSLIKVFAPPSPTPR